MTKKKPDSPSWADIRAALDGADRAALLTLVRDLYGFREENRDFLHARLLPNENTLVPFMQIIERNISPAEPWKQPLSLSRGRRAISDYRKAVGDPDGLAQLMLFYVECGVNFTLDFGDIDEAFYASVERVYADGLKMLGRCDAKTVRRLLPRFEAVIDATAGIGWGFHDGLREEFELLAPDP